MSDVSAIFGTLLILGIAFPGLLTALWLLFPALVERAAGRLEQTPWSTFWLGLGAVFALAIPIVALIALPFGPAKFLGWTLLAVCLAFSGVGAAGLVSRIGSRLAGCSHGLSPAAAFVRGAIVLELAAVFPLIGWLIVIPLAVIVSLGAMLFALLRWMPRAQAQAQAPAPVSAPPSLQV
jgi:hypothetical protein